MGKLVTGFEGRLTNRVRPGMTISVGGKVVAHISELHYYPAGANIPKDLIDIYVADADKGWTAIHFDVHRCKKCERRTDGRRRLLFWRRWHKRTCAISQFWDDIQEGRYTGFSMGTEARKWND